MLYVNIDFETRSGADLPTEGAERYASDLTTQAVCCAYRLSTEDTTRIWWPDWVSHIIKAVPPDPPPHEYLQQSGIDLSDVLFTAWNSAFDRKIWNYVCVNDYDWPYLDNEHWLCTSSLARVNNLPGSLGHCAQALKSDELKDTRGNELIKQLSLPNGGTRTAPTFNEDPDAYKHFLAYCVQDVNTEAGMLTHLRPFSDKMLREFHVSEHINDRGIPVDVDFARLAVTFSQAELDVLSKDICKLTRGVITKPTQYQRIKKFLLDGASETSDEYGSRYGGSKHLTPLGVKTMETYKGGERKYSFDKSVRAELFAMDSNDADSVFATDDAFYLAELCDLAGKSSTAKYQRMIDTEVDGVVQGAYVFAGAAATNRYSARSVQPHNLVRSSVEDFEESKRLLAEGLDDSPIHTLASMMRQTIVAPPGRVFHWSDWSNIEGRGLPWLADTAGALQKLEQFRYCDMHPDEPDVYMQTANSMGLTDRQMGKVCVAQDTMVLCDTGLKPIQDVLITDLVWDGVEFVKHEGVVCNGIKEVIHYQGLSATPDHIVYTEIFGRCELQQAQQLGARIIQSGNGEQKIRTGESGSSEQALGQTVGAPKNVCPVYRMWPRRLDKLNQHIKRSFSRMSTLCATAASTPLGRPAFACGAPAVYQPRQQTICQLWGSRHRIPLRFDTRSRTVCANTTRLLQNETAGSDRQRQALRAGEYPLGDGQTEHAKHAKVFRIARPLRSLRALAIRSKYCTTLSKGRGPGPRTDTSACLSSGQRETQRVANHRGAPAKVKVYDIVNAGPRHRFTANNLLVSNCELSLGYGGSVGAFKAMARNYGVSLPDSEIQTLVHKWRHANAWAPEFWAAVKEAAWSAMNHPGVKYRAGKITYQYQPDDYNGLGALYAHMPSGHIASYVEAQFAHVPVPWDENETMIELVALKANMQPKAGASRWPLSKLWSGCLVENLTQRLCGDILRDRLVALHDAGLCVRLHTHDEVLIEADMGDDDAPQKFLDIMQTPPEWLTRFPLAADLNSGTRYQKT